MFDANKYFKEIVESNLLLINNCFDFKRVSGVKGLEEVVNSMRTSSAMFALDDSADGMVINVQSNPIYRRVFVCYIFKKARLNNMDDYTANLELCREIFQQVLSKIMLDSEHALLPTNISLNTDQVHFKEMEGQQLNGATGVYFLFHVDEATNLCYKSQQWK